MQRLPATLTDVHTEERRGPGRPPEYDRDAVLMGAIDVFWRKGFAATSLSDLEAALDINRSTIYAAFDGKDGLYAAAVERYLGALIGPVLQQLRDGNDGLADVVAFIDVVEGFLVGADSPAGCLILNSIGTPNPAPNVAEYVLAERDALRAAFGRAESAGELAPGRCEACTDTVLAGIVGMTAIGNSEETSELVPALAASLRATITSWRP